MLGCIHLYYDITIMAPCDVTLQYKETSFSHEPVEQYFATLQIQCIITIIVINVGITPDNPGQTSLIPVNLCTGSAHLPP